MAMIYITARAVFPASEHKTEEWLKENSGLSELYGVELKCKQAPSLQSEPKALSSQRGDRSMDGQTHWGVIYTARQDNTL
ncbi:hypothetical protein [Thermospira aquatica]|uniref:Uncharacterized protein n=1 Tax=Thermospira aquatica TaxID=2828656 RepID=A0AAX3BBH8_9SPIR|nr:hypothetical protein [Thermospira aquatica]URA09673.1 hypothetical protein KDW03_09310 [Thermospira aquatica]